MPPGKQQTRQQDTQQSAPQTAGPQASQQGLNRQPAGNSAANATVAALAQNLPTGQLNLDEIASVHVGPVPMGAALVEGNLKLGGSLSAKPVGSNNPATVSTNGSSSSVSAGGNNGSASVSSDGQLSSKIQSTLGGITSSVSVSLNGGTPSVSFGAAGEFGSVESSVEPVAGGLKYTYVCSPKEIKKEINGIEVSGSISYTLELTIRPNPVPWYQKVYDWVGEQVSNFADWLADHKAEVMTGVLVIGTIAAAAAIVMSGGAAAPALALGS